MSLLAGVIGFVAGSVFTISWVIIGYRLAQVHQQEFETERDFYETLSRENRK